MSSAGPRPQPAMERGTPRRSRPGSRGAAGRDGRGLDAVDAEYAPVRDPGPSDATGAARHERQPLLEDGPYGGPPPPPAVTRSAHPSPSHHSPDFTMKHGLTRDTYILELQAQNGDFQRELSTLKRELELTGQKLGSSMHSIKTFWSPELKKERQMRKEESAKYAMMGEQIQLLNSETQVRRRPTALRCWEAGGSSGHFRF